MPYVKKEKCGNRIWGMMTSHILWGEEWALGLYGEDERHNIVPMPWQRTGQKSIRGNIGFARSSRVWSGGMQGVLRMVQKFPLTWSVRHPIIDWYVAHRPSQCFSSLKYIATIHLFNSSVTEVRSPQNDLWLTFCHRICMISEAFEKNIKYQD